MKENSLVLIELDAIRRSITGSHWLSTPCDQEPIPGAKALLDALLIAGYCPVGLSNQSAVGMGHKSLEGTIAEQMITLRLLPQLNMILFCPDFRGKSAFVCTRSGARQIPAAARHTGLYRMPKPGMALFAADQIESNPVAAIAASDAMRTMSDELHLTLIDAGQARQDPKVTLALIAQEEASDDAA